MAKLDNVRRIIKEDYDKEYHDLINKLSYTLNTFMEGVVAQVNGNLDFSNLRQEIITYKVKVNTSGTPEGNKLIKTGFPKPRGIVVLAAKNPKNSEDFVTAPPFITFKDSSSSTLEIQNITGLTAGTTYELTLLIID